MPDLSIGGEQIVISAGAGGNAVTLAAGGSRIARECFHDRFPQPGELEAAIAVHGLPGP